MIHLHVHSNYSLLEGAATVRQLIARAVEHGMPALALTDTDGLYAAVPFYTAAREAGIKPIVGAVLEGAVLLARNREGYAELCHLITQYQLHNDFRLSDQPLSDDLFVLTSNRKLIKTLCAKGLRPLVAITHHGDTHSRYEAAALRDYAIRKGLRPVAVCPVYFLDPGDARVHRVLTAIRLNTNVDLLEPHELAHPASWFRSPKELRSLYADWPDTLNNAEWVAGHCNLELELGRPRFPECTVPRGENAFSHLWKRAFAGLSQRYKPITPRAVERLQRELDVIYTLGFAPYFLIVSDIVDYARAREIPIVGRGSAANSIVSYALGITRVDPFKYDLYFERFLNPSRTDCPDIDLDICWRRRDDVINYVYGKYGADRVAMICTFNTFRARSAVREVAKALGLPNEQVNRLTRHIPHYGAGDIRTLVRFLPECKGLDLEREPFKSVVDLAEKIGDFPRHLSIHSGGLVIAPEHLNRFVPLQRATKGLLITQYDMGPIEELGLVKMDLLGHRSLSVLDETVQKLRDNRGIEIDLESLPDPDPLTANLIREGRTIGCFQIESPAMRALLRNTLADNTDMLIKTLSLVRPGPSGSGMKKHFIDRRLGREETTYLHPALEEVLKDTYGVMLYQEDTLKVAAAIAGMTLAEGDSLRRAMTKKRSPQEMAKNMRSFLERAAANGVDTAIAEEIWGQIANFAKYSYCKAHAATYGEISYQCTYLKAHYPAEFLSSVLSNRGGFYHPAVYLEEAKRLGVEIRPPDVNRSRFTYTVEGDAVRIGFVEVRGLSQGAVHAILDARDDAPFVSIGDLCRRANIGPSDAEVLIQSGACDSFGPARPILLWELQMLRQPQRVGEGMPLELLLPDGDTCPLLPAFPDYSRRHRADLEWTHLGLLPDTHPIEYYLHVLGGEALVLSGSLPDYVGREVTMLGWLIAERRVALKGRGCMKFVTFEDPCGVYEGILFPRAYQAYGHLLDTHGPYLVTGEVQNEDHCCTLVIERIEKAGQAPKSPGTSTITPPLSWFGEPYTNGRIAQAD
ncbi:MAG: DNA polymerase III subunit alpha [FCB group bacterium]|jgi:DNA-directed DNA polymerase III PolC|nr:DNA polymerase III subunit alpha [FCB group bacterium]